MKSLSANWFTEGLIDLEYKQYLVLGYLQEVRRYFDRTELYPAFSDLIFHYRNLQAYRERKQTLSDQFPRRLLGFSLKPPGVQYENKNTEQDAMLEIDQIVEYSLEVMTPAMGEGKHLYDVVDRDLIIGPVGVVPLYRQDGYVFVRSGTAEQTHIYRFEATVFDEGGERYGGIHLEALETREHGRLYTYEQMKLELIRQRPDLPNPAAFAVETPHPYPIEETVLPVAKRRLIRYVMTDA